MENAAPLGANIKNNTVHHNWQRDILINAITTFSMWEPTWGWGEVCRRWLWGLLRTSGLTFPDPDCLRRTGEVGLCCLWCWGDTFAALGDKLVRLGICCVYSSGSRGLVSGDGKCRLLRSGREPVLLLIGMLAWLVEFSSDGCMLVN